MKVTKSSGNVFDDLGTPIPTELIVDRIKQLQAMIAWLKSTNTFVLCSEHLDWGADWPNCLWRDVERLRKQLRDKS